MDTSLKLEITAWHRLRCGEQRPNSTFAQHYVGVYGYRPGGVLLNTNLVTFPQGALERALLYDLDRAAALTYNKIITYLQGALSGGANNDSEILVFHSIYPQTWGLILR